MKRLIPLLLAACATRLPTEAPAPKGPAAGHPLAPEQEAYDVQHYALELRVSPDTRTIEGSLTATVRCTFPMARLVLDLDDALKVAAAEENGKPLTFHHQGGILWIDLGRWRTDTVRVTVRYGGTPRVAPNPPWDGGFTWAKTGDGRPWIATTCQMNGADLWWPCKDHPSDKPESMDLRITVPEGLVVASNGTLQSSEGNVYHWRIANPISNYNVALNIAPYEVIRAKFASVGGETVPVEFYVLPEHVEQGRKALDGFLDHLKFMEETCGPYPFRNEKYGIAETPHLGMEHQTIIAYGNKFRADERGYDWLHAHELSHEWWGNLVTNRNWKDMWIHEGIGTYMQALYLERRFGREAYLAEMARIARHANTQPVAPREPHDSKAIYHGDLYSKGAWFMHMLRWVLTDPVFFRVLRRLAYPDPAAERRTDGSQVRFSDTEEICAIAERESGRELDWLFEMYLRRTDLPELVERREGNDLVLEWKAPVAFPMPVPVRVEDSERRVEVPGRITVPEGQSVAVDPENLILRKR